MTVILGLTGGIASGKSTVSRYLNEFGFPVVDADIIAREVVEPGTIGLQQIIATFSEAVLKADGHLNRQYLGRIVFGQSKELAKLTKITAPLIRETITKRLQLLKEKKASLIVLDVPLMFETGYDKLTDVTLLVEIPKELQLQRLMRRDQLTYTAALARINTQWPLAKKRALADVVIDNSGTVAQTKQQMLDFLKQNHFV
ncbi:dephospho-CoA kinase [Loigolactobacillus backii]|uniref:Dephospho-CoA kinase n=1 Tax=Loigolactobacillus backii TaxID=375175 RepID=A0A192H416_9LACO|nr:dephospho-CoA kinase [Loigolactobacillus backii]ANK59298.1 dephospho-CoA kinase [Loigolactobacillus backii]ANK62711.1 dephospho-CoA kinase [Loigolactobacillus backii]ANK64290.1 dephospho-CoA kinase [Loigolactobacillus backii]ANK67316.1 dephospho-CoA kinase [Loigolactobacillus backii]ANK70281.1 dephospho-CoA kinase [Loigolactobacillus backii]